MADEFELYDLTSDPMELSNRYGDPTCPAQRAAMVEIHADPRAKKRISPLSGVAAGQ